MIFHKFCPLCGVSRLPWRTMEDHGAMVPSWHHGFPMVFIGWLYGDYRVNPGPMVIAADTKAIAHSKELRDEARTGCQFLSAAPTVARCSLGETTSQPPPYCHTNPHNAYLSHCKNMGIYIYIHCHHGFHNMDNVRMVSQRLFFPAPRLQVSYPDVDMQLEPSLEKQFIQHLTCNKGHSHNVLCVVIIFIMSRTDMIRPAIPHFHQWKPPCLNGKHEDLDTALLVSRSSYL